MANRNYPSSRVFSGHIMAVELDCNFVVDSANGNGLGIRNLKGPFIQNVFMHTSASPGIGNSNPQTPGQIITNPNPAPGTIIVQLQDNYNRILSGSNSIVSALGSNLKVDSADAALTPGVGYVITILGDATAADWIALGVPAGIVPAVGVAFIAKVSGSGIASVSRVAPSIASSPVGSIEILGDSNQALGPSISQQGFGAQIILQCRQGGSIATPSDGSVISLQFLLSNSSILIQGE